LSIVVFGSINMDLVARVPRLLLPGETLIGRTFTTVSGGKGANQAVACARLGATTRMIGRVGDDAFGEELRESLEGYGVDTAGVAVHPGTASGVAVITVDDAGENEIVVIPGANATVGRADLERLDVALAGARVLLLQLEVPLDAVMAAAALAHTRGVIVILDPAPSQPLPVELYAATDILTPNEVEAAALVGFPLDSQEVVTRAGTELLKRGAHSVVIKLGGQGVYWSNGMDSAFHSAFRVEAVDTVGAGDAFNGALAVGLSEGLDMPEAIRWGLVAGALSATQPGAQSAMPDRAAVERLLVSRKA
jgi:ribokinase